MPTIPVVASDTHRAHDVPFELDRGQRVSPVPERPARVHVIEAALRSAGHRFLGPTEHGDGPLLAVHDPDLVAFLRDGHEAWVRAGGPEVMIADTYRSPRWAGGGRRSASPFGQLGWWCFDTATPLVAGSYEAGRAAVDLTLTGADRILAGESAVYALTRPPGHHAGHDYFGGFCLFNHAAVAARSLAADARVAILDVDVHHGNGTQDVFWTDPDVLYVSLHGDPDHLFPYFSGFSDEVGQGPGRGSTHNLPLGRGTDDAAYLDALRVATEVVDDAAPEVLVVSLGLDAAAVDPIGSLGLSPAAFGEIGRRIGALGLPTLLVQEGGYAVDHLGDLAVATLAGVEAAHPDLVAAPEGPSSR